MILNAAIINNDYVYVLGLYDLYADEKRKNFLELDEVLSILKKIKTDAKDKNIRLNNYKKTCDDLKFIYPTVLEQFNEYTSTFDEYVSIFKSFNIDGLYEIPDELKPELEKTFPLRDKLKFMSRYWHEISQYRDLVNHIRSVEHNIKSTKSGQTIELFGLGIH